MFCGKCGIKLEDGARFCGACGAPVQMPTIDTPPVQETAVPTVELENIPEPISEDRAENVSKLELVKDTITDSKAEKTIEYEKPVYESEIVETSIPVESTTTVSASVETVTENKNITNMPHNGYENNPYDSLQQTSTTNSQKQSGMGIIIAVLISLILLIIGIAGFVAYKGDLLAVAQAIKNVVT